MLEGTRVLYSEGSWRFFPHHSSSAIKILQFPCHWLGSPCLTQFGPWPFLLVSVLDKVIVSFTSVWQSEDQGKKSTFIFSAEYCEKISLAESVLQKLATTVLLFVVIAIIPVKTIQHLVEIQCFHQLMPWHDAPRPSEIARVKCLGDLCYFHGPKRNGNTVALPDIYEGQIVRYETVVSFKRCRFI